ncbi:hypothetical protein HPB50_013187 [Hyalomma asiaticum]|uniref:Uncharacterized protein n=1 Tax=Hyalomma asiaticum TaxID=266040 RepID=A0ACB7S8K3_HYAAI|nr:hypothetical protein HPB50_013187 [Hyalomma asiaticum]
MTRVMRLPFGRPGTFTLSGDLITTGRHLLRSFSAPGGKARLGERAKRCLGVVQRSGPEENDAAHEETRNTPSRQGLVEAQRPRRTEETRFSLRQSRPLASGRDGPLLAAGTRSRSSISI